MKTFNISDRVKVAVKENEYEGVVMPSHDENVLMLKLDSGYNMGIKKENITNLEIVKVCELHGEKIEKKIPKDENKKNIMILHTGGTIASKVDYETGGVVSQFSAEDIINMFPELGKIANISSKLISNMQSDDMRFAHYNIIAKAIEEEIKKGSCDGIILTQGTDTLHYTAAALSFMLEHLNIPVIALGSQRSSDRGSSDAGMNLICAANFIINSDFAGVATCMHDTSEDNNCLIIDGINSRKMHSSRRDAFKSINKPAIATVSYPDGVINYISKKHVTKDDVIEPLCVRLMNEQLKIGMLFIHPNMTKEEFAFYENFDGLVILGTGLGHCPISEMDAHTKIHAEIKNTIRSIALKIPVAITTQTIFGRVDMNVYSPGRELSALGVLGNYCDMTPETAFIKLAYLLSNYDMDVIKQIFGENLRGEISDRSDSERSYLKND